MEDKQVVSFLEKWKEKILTTGKYINVIRECGLDVSIDVEEFSFDDSDNLSFAHMVGEKVERAYRFSSKQLLNLILNQCNLMKRLKLRRLVFFSFSHLLL